MIPKLSKNIVIEDLKDFKNRGFYNKLEKILGLIESFKCPFLDQNNKCMIYKVAPLSCKRWGLQSEEQNKIDLKTDWEHNKKLQNYFKQYGIIIPDETVYKVTPFCKNVKIVKNPYNITHKDFDSKFLKEMNNMIFYFGIKNLDGANLSSYLTYLVLEKSMHENRIKVIKVYQNGNSKAVDEFVDSLDLSSLI